MFGRILASLFLAPAGLLAAAGTAGADVVQVEGSYSTEAACVADGPHVQITENNGAYSQWGCQLGDDGLYYLFLSD